MTKQELKLKSMLNYFEIDLKGIKDERMTKQELDHFLNKFNQYMDFHILEEIIKNIKTKREDELDNMEDMDEDEEDPMLPKKNKNKKPKDDYKTKKDDDIFDDNNESLNLNDPLNTDVNKFLRWLTLVLYSGDHTVIVTEDEKGIYIKLVKINKGKK